MKLSVILALVSAFAAAALVSGCATSKIHGDDKDVVAYSGKRPDWVNDSNSQSQEKMRDLFNDKQDTPKYYYVVSQAFVDNEDLVPNCYEFADANSATALGYSLSKEVSAAKSQSGDQSSTSAYAESIVKTKGTLVGSEMLSRYWEKTRDKDHNERVTCWIATGIPRKNFDKAKDLLEKKLEDAQAGNAAKRVKANAQGAVDDLKND
jgi:hypothetical protein